jgi:hypothetical protein
MKDKNGFIPLSTAAILLVLLAISMVTHFETLKSQTISEAYEDVKIIALLTTAESIRNDLQSLARLAIYESLWSVGKRASEYPTDRSRENAIENLASEKFSSFLYSMPLAYPTNVTISCSGKPAFKLLETENGFAIARIKLPEDMQVTITSTDGDAVLLPKYENLEIFVDSRYFLLQERMRAFTEKLEDVRLGWAWLEYANAYSQILAGKSLRLNPRISGTLFELAWANHELSIFGSADYIETSRKLTEFGRAQLNPAESSLSWLTMPSIDEALAIERLIGECAFLLNDTKANLERARNCMTLASDAIENFCDENTLSDYLTEKIDKAIDYLTKAYSNAKEAGVKLTSFPNNLNKKKSILSPVYERLAGAKSSIRMLNHPEIFENVILEIKGSLAKKVVALKSENIDYESNEDALKEINEKIGNLFSPAENELLQCVEVLGGLMGDLKKIQKVVGGTEKNMPSDLDLNFLTCALDSQRPKFEILDREQFYEIFPPQPVKPHPGISVLHELKVGNVKYRREDPIGILIPNSPLPTPIPLDAIGVTLWWVQWEVELSLKENFIEQIIDFQNPTLLRPIYGSLQIAHEPLAYRWSEDREIFKFRLVILSPVEFNVAQIEN